MIQELVRRQSPSAGSCFFGVKFLSLAFSTFLRFVEFTLLLRRIKIKKYCIRRFMLKWEKV